MGKSKNMEFDHMLISWLATFICLVLRFIVLSFSDRNTEQPTITPQSFHDRRPALTDYEATVNHEYGSIYYPGDD